MVVVVGVVAVVVVVVVVVVRGEQTRSTEMPTRSPP